MAGIKYYRETEKLLQNYKELKASLKIIHQEIIELDYYPSSGMSYDQPGGGTNKISSSTEDTAIRIGEIKTKLQKQNEITKSKLARIDAAIETLDKAEQYIIKGRYTNPKTEQWWEIAYEVKYGERWCKEKRRRAIESISISLYGEAAIPKDSTNTAPKEPQMC